MSFWRNGPALTLLVACTLASRDVYCSGIFQNISIFETILWCFLPVVIVTLILFVDHDQFLILRKNWKLVISINATAASNTLLYFYALKLADPVLVSITLGAMAWLVVYWAESRTGHCLTTLEKRVMFCLIGILLICGGLVVSTGHIGSTKGSHLAILGILMTIVSAIANSYGVIFERRLSLLKVTPLSIMSIRFILLLVISAIVVTSTPKVTGYFVPIELTSVYSIVFPLVVLPALIGQMAIANTKPVTFKAIFALIPTMVLLLELVNHDMHLPNAIFIVVFLYTAVVLIGNYATGWQSSPSQRYSS